MGKAKLILSILNNIFINIKTSHKKMILNCLKKILLQYPNFIRLTKTTEQKLVVKILLFELLNGHKDTNLLLEQQLVTEQIKFKIQKVKVNKEQLLLLPVTGSKVTMWSLIIKPPSSASTADMRAISAALESSKRRYPELSPMLKSTYFRRKHI